MHHHPFNSPFTSSCGTQVYFQGPPLEEGLKPAILYFALSGRATLESDPFNQPVLPLSQKGIRVFSWDLPYHGENLNPQQAMHQWAEEFSRQSSFISDFISLSQEIIQDLIQRGYVSFEQLGVAGLSRGGYIATHLAARIPQIRSVVGFSPLTHPQPIDEFASYETVLVTSYALTTLVDHLIHTPIRFYIGNRDSRVGTDSCYTFIRKLTETAFTQGIRSPSVELILFPSIGHKGHGTPQHIFQQGAQWLIQQLQARSTL